MALRSPRHRLPPLSARHDANTHQSSHPWPEKSSSKNLYPTPAVYGFIHISPILCPSFNVRIKINFSCCANQRRYKISVAAAVYLPCTAAWSCTSRVRKFFLKAAKAHLCPFHKRPAFSLPLESEGLTGILFHGHFTTDKFTVSWHSVIQIHPYLTD